MFRLVLPAYLLRFGVETLGLDSRIVDPILLPTSDTNLHLQPQIHRSHPLEVLGTGGDVLLIKLLTEVQHMRGEERLSISLEIFLISLEHSIKPGEEFLSTVITVENHRHTIVLGHQPHVLGPSYGSQDSSLLVGVLDTLASQECCSSVGELDDDRRVDVPGSLEDSVDGGGRSAVEGCVVNKS